MKPVIVVITTTFPRWQNDTDPPFVFELCRRLTEDYDVHVTTPMYPGAMRYDCLDGVHVHRFRYFLAQLEKLAGSTGILPTLIQNKMYWFLVPFLVLGAFGGALKLSRKVSPKIIHSHWMIPNGVIGVLVSKLCNANCVVTAHGADVYGLRGRTFDDLRRWVVGRSETTTAVSSALAGQIMEASNKEGKVAVVPMGVDKDRFKCERLNLIEPKLLFVGRLTEKKGVVYLIKAMQDVVRRRPECILTIVGSGEQEEYLIDLTSRLGLQENIFFLGAIENSRLPGVYCTHSIFIAPSIEADSGDSEGFGLTIVEASMAGCLVITTDVGGITDIVEDGVTGMIVKQKDSSAIANKILYSLENPNEMEQVACVARKRCIQKFDWPIIKEKYAEIFKCASLHGA